MIPLDWIEQAAHRIAPYIRHTPTTYDAELDLYLKWENQQVTGSFKVRGALNKVLALQPWERETGLVTASAGNHGQGVALAAQKVCTTAIIFVPAHATPAKVEAMRALGAEVRFVPGGYEQAEQAAMEYAQKQGKTWISPYNDPQVIAGQGTLAQEILADLSPARVRTFVIPVGGGGLLAGIGAALENQTMRPRLIGVNAEASAFMYSLYHRGTQEGVLDLPTLADGLSGAVEPNSVTIPLVRKYADDFIQVSEAEIGRAIAFAWHRYGQKVEGSGAVGLAAFLAGKVSPPALVVISGGNIQPEVHAELCRQYVDR